MKIFELEALLARSMFLQALEEGMVVLSRMSYDCSRCLAVEFLFRHRTSISEGLIVLLTIKQRLAMTLDLFCSLIMLDGRSMISLGSSFPVNSHQNLMKFKHDKYSRK